MNKLTNAILMGFTLSIVLVGFSLYLFYSSFKASIPMADVNYRATIESNKTPVQQKTDNQLASPNNSFIASEWNKFLDSKVSGVLLGSAISTIVSLILYGLNRNNAKRQLIFDIALKNLLPAVYMPILGELRLLKFNNKNINVHKIEGIILDNGSLINFAPEKIQGLLDELFILCKTVNSPDTYNEKESELKQKLEALEKEIMKKFGALIG